MLESSSTRQVGGKSRWRFGCIRKLWSRRRKRRPLQRSQRWLPIWLPGPLLKRPSQRWRLLVAVPEAADDDVHLQWRHRLAAASVFRHELDGSQLHVRWPPGKLSMREDNGAHGVYGDWHSDPTTGRQLWVDYNGWTDSGLFRTSGSLDQVVQGKTKSILRVCQPSMDSQKWIPQPRTGLLLVLFEPV